MLKRALNFLLKLSSDLQLSMTALELCRSFVDFDKLLLHLSKLLTFFQHNLTSNWPLACSLAKKLFCIWIFSYQKLFYAMNNFQFMLRPDFSIYIEEATFMRVITEITRKKMKISDEYGIFYRSFSAVENIHKNCFIKVISKCFYV